MPQNDIIVCRCEDITEKEITDAIEAGYDDIEELKRYLRVGMGPCQGKTCLPLIRKMLARHLGVSIDEIPVPAKRPPLALVRFKSILMGAEK